MLNVVCGDRDTGRGADPPSRPAAGVHHRLDPCWHGGGPHCRATDLKRVHLELGGKAPVIVFDDADVAAAAEGIARAGYFNAGQDCTSATRVLARSARARRFRRRAGRGGPGNEVVGAPDDTDAAYGPLNNVNQLDRVSGLLERATRRTRASQPAAQRIGDEGYFFEPTVVAGLRQDDEMIQDEIFGPVITVQQFSR